MGHRVGGRLRIANCGFEKTEDKDSTVGAAFSRDLAISTT
jgi:hypothetical protein